jgi:hypothetical protein
MVKWQNPERNPQQMLLQLISNHGTNGDAAFSRQFTTAAMMMERACPHEGGQPVKK